MANAPLKNLLPNLDADQYESLKASIKEHGFWPEAPIIVDKHDNIIDGWNRAKAAKELGIEAPRLVISGDFSEWDLTVRAIKANTHRRHLTPAARRQLLKRLKELYDTELKRQGLEAKAAGGRAARSTQVRLNETKIDRGRSAAADATITKFDEPVVAKPPIEKVDRLGTLADVLGSSRATVARDEQHLARIEKIESEAGRQHRDDVIRLLNKPRPNLDELERAVGLRAPLPEVEAKTDRTGWIDTLAKVIDNLPTAMSDDEADALLDHVEKPELIIILLRQWTKVIAERKVARK